HDRQVRQGKGRGRVLRRLRRHQLPEGLHLRAPRQLSGCSRQLPQDRQRLRGERSLRAGLALGRTSLLVRESTDLPHAHLRQGLPLRDERSQRRLDGRVHLELIGTRSKFKVQRSTKKRSFPCALLRSFSSWLPLA